MTLNPDGKIYIAGHQGMVGSAIVRALKEQGHNNLITKNHSELNLCDQAAVKAFYADYRPDNVIIAAAKVGGIYANNAYPAEFIYQNLMIECNLIHGGYGAGVKNLLFLGSSCIYPKLAPQPMPEKALLTGALELTNEPYAIAKIAGIKLCESYNRQYGTNYRSVMPTNLYGPNDNFHPENSHVIPALMRKLYEAKKASCNHVDVWGTGKALREFLHVDDMASACLHVANMSQTQFLNATEERCSHINVGSGSDVSIGKLVEMMQAVVGFDGEIRFDASKPDGAPRKLLDCQRLVNSGWLPDIQLSDGLRHTYQWFLANLKNMRN